METAACQGGRFEPGTSLSCPSSPYTSDLGGVNAGRAISVRTEMAHRQATEIIRGLMGDKTLPDEDLRELLIDRSLSPGPGLTEEEYIVHERTFSATIAKILVSHTDQRVRNFGLLVQEDVRFAAHMADIDDAEKARWAAMSDAEGDACLAVENQRLEEMRPRWEAWEAEEEASKETKLAGRFEPLFKEYLSRQSTEWRSLFSSLSIDTRISIWRRAVREEVLNNFPAIDGFIYRLNDEALAALYERTETIEEVEALDLAIEKALVGASDEAETVSKVVIDLASRITCELMIKIGEIETIRPDLASDLLSMTPEQLGDLHSRVVADAPVADAFGMDVL
jgi:hypothetical protein